MHKENNQDILEDKVDENIEHINEQPDFVDEDNNNIAEESIENKLGDLESKLKFAKAEIEDWKSHSTRLAADIQNLGKQQQFDISTAKKSAKKKTIAAVLNFLNTLNLAFSFAPQSSDSNIQKFVDTLKTSFEKVVADLKIEGIEIITPNIGDAFDPSYMSVLNGDSNVENPVVKQVVSLGLKIDDTLVQPAAVMI
jgi:molecular chaperone GrpE (heat shock protein)